jgi:L-ascorbate metabolism protein UlaG (beta-lactamase superfamily)
MRATMKKEVKYNPTLEFIRKDITGNLLLDGEFVFDTKKDKLPIEHLLKWVTTGNPQRKEKKSDTFTPAVLYNSTFLQSSEEKIVWLGHSSFYIHLNNIQILTDPVFYDLTPFLKRRHTLPCSINHFNKIDYILLSHGHRDHLDISTLKKLVSLNPEMQILCPLGFTNILKATGCKHIHEAAWWQQYAVEQLEITFLPAKHWNRRFLTDYNKTLWGSFAIKSETTSIYFAGDTGYAHHFKEINQHFDTFDICLMPVGAYKPKFVMEWAHTSPDEAVMAFHELNGKTFIPMHYGTFDLSDEPASEPIKILTDFYENKQLNGLLKILKVGEIHPI